MSTVELVTTGIAVGGEAVGRDETGRVVFVEGALDGERVRVELTDERKRFARGRVIEVMEASTGRIVPQCAEVERGCGGCDAAHADRGVQFRAKAQMVTDALERLGRLHTVPTISPGPILSNERFRTTVRASVVDGRAGLRQRRSNDWLGVESCRIAHQLVEELLVDGRYGDANEVTIKVGARTGERMVVVSGGESSVGVSVPDDVTVVSAAELAAGRRVWIHEEVDGRSFRISAASFFQTRPDGADALVAIVRDAVAEAGPTAPGRLVDLCSGVGLFAATIDAAHVEAIESNRSAMADAKINLQHLHAPTLVTQRFEKWTPSSADVVIADPSRSGLGEIGVSAVEATGAGRVVLVSCDAASLGRDVGLFAAHGYVARSVTLVDMFPDTFHVEGVTILDRSDSSRS